jgi:hypothetical protein
MEATVSSETLAAHYSKRLYCVTSKEIVTSAEVYSKRIPYFEKKKKKKKKKKKI